MRILYAIYEFFPKYTFALERLTLNLASSMRKAGHRVHVAAYSYGAGPFSGRKQGVLYRRYSYAGIPVTALKYEPSRTGKRPMDSTPGARLWAEDLLSRGDFDLLHAPTPMLTTAFINAAIKNRVPYLITIPNYLYFCDRPALRDPRHAAYGDRRLAKICLKAASLPRWTKAQWSRRTAMAKRILSHAAAVVAPSEFIRSAVKKEHPGMEIGTIPHGGAHADAPTNDRHYVPKSQLTFGYMGRLIPIKGVDVLIKAFRKINNPSCRLEIYGPAEEDYADYSLELLELAYGDKRIAFCGAYSSQEETSAILQKIDVLCFPSLWLESYGLIVEEALAAHVPVLASRIGAVPERIKNGINGLTFAPGDLKGLYSAMNRLAADPTRLNVLKKNITSYTTIEQEASQHESLYRSIVGSNRRA